MNRTADILCRHILYEPMIEVDKNLANIKNFEKLRDELDSSSVSSTDVCLVGSSCLALRKLRLNNDIDLVVSNKADHTFSNTNDLSISVGRYSLFNITNNQLIYNSDYHDMVDGYKIVRPEIEYAFKQYRGKKKDKADIELLNEYRSETDEWNTELIEYSPPTSYSDIISQTKLFGLSAMPHLVSRYADETDSNIGRIVSGRKSILARTYQSLKSDGLNKTFHRGYRLVAEHDPTGLLNTYSNPIYKIKLGRVVEQGAQLQYPMVDLLDAQFQNTEFTRYDTIILLLLLDNTISKKEVRKINDNYFQSNVDRLLDMKNDTERVSVDITPELVVQDPVDFAVALHTNSV